MPTYDVANDENIKKLNELKRFEPVLRSCLKDVSTAIAAGQRDDPSVYDSIDPRPFLQIADRFQEHELQQAQIVAKEQSKIVHRVKEASFKVLENCARNVFLCADRREIDAPTFADA